VTRRVLLAVLGAAILLAALGAALLSSPVLVRGRVASVTIDDRGSLAALDTSDGQRWTVHLTPGLVHAGQVCTLVVDLTGYAEMKECDP